MYSCDTAIQPNNATVWPAPCSLERIRNKSPSSLCHQKRAPRSAFIEQTGGKCAQALITRYRYPIRPGLMTSQLFISSESRSILPKCVNPSCHLFPVGVGGSDVLLPVVLLVVRRHRERHRVVRHAARLLVPEHKVGKNLIWRVRLQRETQITIPHFASQVSSM